MYEVPDNNVPLSQGDIIDDCPVFSLKPSNPNPDSDPDRYNIRALVLTQSCDLAQGKADRVVVAVVQKAQELVDRGVIKATVIRDQVRRGLVYGLYFLPSAQEPIQFPESIVDLRDLHTVPRAILESLVADGKRVGTIGTPWREHLAQHFGVTYMRIGLPEPYQSEP